MEYLTLEELGFTRENFFFIPTARSFLLVKEHFEKATLIGFDAEYKGEKLSTVTFATEEKVAVFDVISLKRRRDKEVLQYIKDIILSQDIEIITHTFRNDAYMLKQSLDIDPFKIDNALDLTEIIKDKDSRNKISFQKMVQSHFNKALNQYYKKSDWEKRPISDQMIAFSALNALAILKIFKKYDKANPDVGMKYYDYIPPST